MGGGGPKQESMAVRDLEQSQLSTAANNVEVAGNWDNSNCLGEVKTE
jgi:hypothetical protein